MIAFDNATPGNLESLCNTCNCAGFAPSATYNFDAAAAEITVVGASTFGAGDAFKNMNVEAYDQAGNSVKGAITAAPGSVVLNVSTLDLSKPIGIKATVSSTGGCVSDGSVTGLLGDSAGSLGSWDKDFTSSEAVNIAAPPTLS